MSMLSPKVLPQVLSQAVSGGVKSAIIITHGGDLLACSGTLSSDRLVSAIALNIWSLYSKAAEEVDSLLIDCEDGHFAVTKAGKFLICIYGDHTAEFGMLKAKAEALHKSLDDPLSKIL